MFSRRFPALTANLAAALTLGRSVARLPVRSMARPQAADHYGRKDFTVPMLSNEPLGGTSPNDDDLNFFLRCLVEGHYARVIEIGADRCARIKRLKHLVPERDYVGLDISGPFTDDSVSEGVRLRHFDRLPQEICSETLVISRATLCCFDGDSLQAFLALLSRKGADLALCEPGFHWSFGESRVRSKLSYYHDWKACLEGAGLTLEGTEHTPLAKSIAESAFYLKTNGEGRMRLWARSLNKCRILRP